MPHPKQEDFHLTDFLYDIGKWDTVQRGLALPPLNTLELFATQLALLNPKTTSLITVILITILTILIRFTRAILIQITCPIPTLIILIIRMPTALTQTGATALMELETRVTQV
jgi:hypothetical protein